MAAYKRLDYCRWPAVCGKCGVSLPRGHTAWYYCKDAASKSMRALCPSCWQGRPEPQPEPKAEPRAEPRPEPKPEPRPDGVRVCNYDSLSAVAEVAARAKDLPASSHDNDRQSEEWRRGYTVAQAAGLVAAAREPVKRAYENAKANLGGDLSLPTRPARFIRRGCEDGTELDPERVALRDCTPWDRQEYVDIPAHVVTIGVEIHAHCQETEEDVAYAGAAACVLAERLVLQGQNVQIVAYGRQELYDAYDAGEQEYRVIVKRPDAPLDLESVITACADIAWFRMQLLAAQHVQAGCHSNGRRIDEVNSKQFDYWVSHELRNRERAAEWLREKLEGGANACS